MPQDARTLLVLGSAGPVSRATDLIVTPSSWAFSCFAMPAGKQR